MACVIVAEDSPALLALFRHVLFDAGYTVLPALTGWTRCRWYKVNARTWASPTSMPAARSCATIALRSATRKLSIHVCSGLPK